MPSSETTALFLLMSYLFPSLPSLDRNFAGDLHQPEAGSDSLNHDSRAALFREKQKVLKQQGLLLEFNPACQKAKQERNMHTHTHTN